MKKRVRGQVWSEPKKLDGLITVNLSPMIPESSKFLTLFFIKQGKLTADIWKIGVAKEIFLEKSSIFADELTENNKDEKKNYIQSRMLALCWNGAGNVQTAKRNRR